MNAEILALARKHWPLKSIYGAGGEFVPGQTLIPYSGPVWDEEEVAEAISAFLEGEWLSSGEKVREFERKFSKAVGQKWSVMCNSGSSANLLMISALRSKRFFGSHKISVLTPAAGFPTTLAPILQNGFTPVLVDIEMQSLNLDLDQVEAKLTPDVKALIFAHVLGNPPDLDRLQSLCKSRDVLLLEDNCDAFGSTWDGRPLGGFGAMSSCSFYPAHHITTIEGGMVSTGNPDFEKVVRSLCQWGKNCYCVGKANLLQNGTCKHRFDAWLEALPDVTVDHKYVFTEMGYNLKPLDLQGAIGLSQLKKVDRIHKARKANYKVYRDFFSQFPGLFKIADTHPKADVSWFGFPITVITDRFTRKDLVAYLEDAKIQTRSYFAGNLLFHPGYAHLGDPYDYPNSVTVTRSTFFLGVSPNLKPEHLEYVKEKVSAFVSKH